MDAKADEGVSTCDVDAVDADGSGASSAVGGEVSALASVNKAATPLRDGCLLVEFRSDLTCQSR